MLANVFAARLRRTGSPTSDEEHIAVFESRYLNLAELPLEGALPLGALAGVEFPVLRFQLEEGDSLTFMTDGIAEAQDASGELFGFERAGEMLRVHVTALELARAAQVFGQ